MKKLPIIFLLVVVLITVIYLLDITGLSPFKQTRKYIQPNYDEGSRTIQRKEDQVEINFLVCEEDRRRVDVGFGSTTIAVEGKKSDFCRMYYGGEVENPDWNGDLPYVCNVPIDKGVIRFQSKMFGVDFEPILEYCTK